MRHPNLKEYGTTETIEPPRPTLRERGAAAYEASVAWAKTVSMTDEKFIALTISAAITIVLCTLFGTIRACDQQMREQTIATTKMEMESKEHAADKTLLTAQADTERRQAEAEFARVVGFCPDTTPPSVYPTPADLDVEAVMAAREQRVQRLAAGMDLKEASPK